MVLDLATVIRVRQERIISNVMYIIIQFEQYAT